MRPLRTLVACLLATAVLGVPGVPPAQAQTPQRAGALPSLAAPALAAAARYDTWVAIHPMRHHHKYGKEFSISGQVRYAKAGNTYALAGARVKLLRRPAGSAQWNRIATDWTSHTRKPVYRFVVSALGNSRYRVRFAGDQERQAAANSTRVWVHHRVPAKIARTSSGLRLVGHVEPHRRYQRVGLYKRDCRSCRWHHVRGQQTNRRSAFDFGIGAPRHGSWFFRVRVPANARFARSVTATFRTYTP